MKRLLEAFLILLNSGFVAAGMIALVIKLRREKTPLGIGGWFLIVTIGIPAILVFVATLIGYQ